MTIPKKLNLLIAALSTIWLIGAQVRAAELSAGDVTMPPGTMADVVVSGVVSDEMTYGYTILVEIIPRGGNLGTVTFSASPPPDIVPGDDPWPTSGTFTLYDTDAPGFSDTLNGVVDDDGRFLCDLPVTFNGPLATFPVTASADADGVWDVFLSTSAGDSNWECLTTTLLAGTITVSTAECFGDGDCDDLVPCTDDTCSTGTCVYTPNNANCPDDGSYCNGAEVCDAVLDCISTGDPCQPDEFCNDLMDTCDECQFDSDCTDSIGCTDDACVGGGCTSTPNDANCPDDGAYCNGVEYCDPALDCLSTGNPCPPEDTCDELSDACVACTMPSECDDGNVCTDDDCNAGACEYFNNTLACDDGFFCTLTDVCSGGNCIGSGDPCPGEICDDATDACVPPVASLTANDLVLSRGDIAELLVSGVIVGDRTYGVTIMVEIVPRSGAVGTVRFTTAPPVDIVQRGDPWPLTGTFSRYDTNAPGFSYSLNGSVDDNGSFIANSLYYTGLLSGFPVTVSSDAGGMWDVYLTTSAGDSEWEGVTTVLNAGTISVPPSAGITVESRAMPPGSIADVVVYGDIEGETTSAVNVLLEIVGRTGNVGTLEFTPAFDILQLGDPWGGYGTFSAFDSTSPGFSLTLNGSVHGTFSPGPLTYSGALTAFPVQASSGADGTWDLVLLTSAGPSGWEDVLTALGAGTITVSPGACLIDEDCDDSNTCTAETCNLGVCEYTTVTGACNDSDPCTENDTCQGDVCVGSAVDCSSLDDACNLGTCNPTTGVCEPAPANEGGPCDDEDLCTENDSCSGGMCAGTPKDCTGLDDACNVGTCNPATGVCEPIPTNEGGLCDDNDLCTESDQCAGGVCAGTPVDCSAYDDQCHVGTCNPSTGDCEALPGNEGSPCDDADPCNVDETCQSGVCTGGNPVDCSGVGQPCDLVSCDANGLEGNCDIVTTAPDDAPCDDGLFCTLTDTCSGGVCIGTGDTCPGRVCDDTANACFDCFVAADCNDANPCTDDLCVARNCIYSYNSASCNDQNPCTLSDRCSGGVCVGSSPVNCSGAGDQCNVASCDTNGLLGNCDIRTPVPNGTGCNDGNLCTLSDQCQVGVCVGTPKDCSALDDDCHVGVCRLSTGTCRAEAANEGGVCDDGVPCTENDVCSDGVCRGTLIGGPKVDLTWSPSAQSVPVGQSVFIDLIASSATCVDQPIGSVEVILNWNPTTLQLIRKIDTGPISWLISAFPNDAGVDGLNAPFTGTPANDGDAFYQALAGFGSGAVAPPSGVVITTFEFGTLDGSTGTSVTIPPSAGSFTLTRVLGAGPDLGIDVTGSLGSATVAIAECQVAGDCDDANVCTTDTCSSGVCQNTNNTVSCDDGLFCTADDTCSGGECVGANDPCTIPLLCSEDLDACVECLTSEDCSDGNICTDDVCDAFGSCSNPNNTLSCNDGVFCTAVDVCDGGTCVGTGDTCPGLVCDEPNDRCVECLGDGDCDDSNVCTTDSCAGNVCSRVPNSLSCNDGRWCTVTDTCVGGACIGTVNPCTTPLICSEALDACVECEVAADCDDGNICTTENCFSNICFNTNNTAPCNDGLFCTTLDRCSSGSCVGSGDACPDQLCDEPNDRCVDCFTVGDCPDDNVDCTVDTCDDGACLYPPDDVFCDDGLFCNGPEFCHTTLDCQPGTVPCDDPALCAEGNDSCGCQEPVVAAEGCRYLGVTPRPGQTPVALLVSGVDSGVACVSLYVQGNGTLGPNPVYKPPTGVGGWGTAHVRGVEIIPSTSYVVQTQCDTGQGIGLSTAAQDTTWQWGDTDDTGGLVDVRDFTWVADGFRGQFLMAERYAVDLWGAYPENCGPELVISILDIMHCIDAFKQFPFPCDEPCP